MIRMGRGSKTEQPTTNTDYQEQTAKTNSFYPYTTENQPTSSRAISESESMARDIKEGRLSGFVGNGTVLTGETNFQSMLRVDGHLTGRVSSENGTLIIGSTGKVDANITVAAAVISGTVNGDIICSEKLELGRSARVVGNVQTPRLVIDEGGILEGSCSMIKAKEAADKRSSETYSQPAANSYSSYQMSEAEDSAEDDDEEGDVEETAEAAAS